MSAKAIKSLIIGGAGFIGQELVSVLKDGGREVVVNDRINKNEVSFPASVQYYVGDYANREFLKQLIEDLKIDEVVFLAYASVPKTSYENPMADLTNNLSGALNLFDTLSQFPLKKIIIVSSGGTVYGHVKSVPISEDCLTNPISPYGITKLTIEKYALMYSRMKNLPVIIARPSNAYGERQKPYTGQGLIATLMASIIEGKEMNIFGAEPVRDYLHVCDLTRGLECLLNKGKIGEIYNLGSGRGVSNAQVLAAVLALAKERNFQSKINFVSGRPFDVAVNVLNIGKIYQDTGWQPEIDFNDRLEKIWDYLIKKNSLC